MLTLELKKNKKIHSHTWPIIDYASALWDSASASIHKRAHRLTLLKSIFDSSWL